MAFIALLILSFNSNGYTKENKVVYDYEANLVLAKKKQQPVRKRRRVIRRPQYHPIKNPGTAATLSAIIPGMGQVYAGNHSKGALFLISEVALFAAASFNFDRANYYDFYADRYPKFRDEYGDSFITYRQGYVEAKKYNTLGAMFLLSTLGVHVWNVFDAADTARDYNKSHGLKLGFKFQPKEGTYLALSKQF